METDQEIIDEAYGLLEIIRAELVGEIPEETDTFPGQKLVRLTLMLREALRHRVVDLCDEAIAMFQQERLVPACILTRSIYETVALLFYTHKKIAEACENEEIDEINEFIKRGSWGSKDETTEEEAIQILTAIKHTNKVFKGLEKEYFHLCEYAHPNMKGTLGAYSKITIPNIGVKFGINPEPLPMGPFGLGGLPLILAVAIDVFKNLEAIEPEYTAMVYKNAVGKFDN